MSALEQIIMRTIVPAACVVGIAYNAALTVNGPDGLRATAVLEARLVQERAALVEGQERIAALSARADGLLMASLDEDLLEESLRSRLGLVAEDELMVRMDDLDKLAAMAPAGDGAIKVAALTPR